MKQKARLGLASHFINLTKKRDRLNNNKRV